MKLIVQRVHSTASSVMGDLSVDGQHRAFTLEPPFRSVKPHAIPAGSYDLTIRWSNKWGRLMPHVENVPGFEAIEIHSGNYPKDTEGCLLVGATMATDFVGDSRKTFAEIFEALYSASVPRDRSDVRDCGTITYIDPASEAGA